MTELSPSSLLSRSGAVAAEGIDAGVVAHFGNPFAEQRELAAGRAVVEVPRAVLTVTGEDRLIWLHNLTSQNLRMLAPGASTETLLLSQTGRIEHVLRVIDDGVALWLLVERSEAEPLAAWLNSMRFMMRVEVADRSNEFVIIGTLAEPPIAPAAPNDVPLTWVDPWHEPTFGGHQYSTVVEHPATEWTYREFLLERERVSALESLPVAGVLALEALRIAAWRPRLTTEVDEKAIPHEFDWLRSSVHLSKGCYRGQETVAKVHNLGHPPRRLVMLHLDGSDSALPAPGAEVQLDGKPVGHVTSVAQHFELGPIALALVKRMAAPDATLTVAAEGLAVSAAQEVIVPVDAGMVAPRPKIGLLPPRTPGR